MKSGVLLLALLVLPARAQAQADVVVLARTAAAEGRRVQALTALEQHLTQSPADVDARLMYGLILSWEGRYDEARLELQWVLASTPAYLDARIALMHVELWSGRRQDATALAVEILSREPGNPQARLVRQRLNASRRTWTANVTYSHDRFSDGRGSWHEHAVSLSRATPIGSFVVLGTRAARFSLSDEQVEVELYPIFRAGTYAFVGFGVAPDAALYPRHRSAFDLYQSLGRGPEISAGYRRLHFGEVTHVYLAALTKYVGRWTATGKFSYVPGSLDSPSYHAVVRRYFGADGTSFIGFGYSYGLNREEIRHLGDLVTVAFDTVRGQVDADLAPRWRLQVEAGTSRQEQSWGTVGRPRLAWGCRCGSNVITPMLVLFATRDDLNRATRSGLLPARQHITLSLDRPGDLLAGALAHELAHTFLCDLLPRVVVNDLPLWFSEGLHAAAGWRQAAEGNS
jgi:YaiO family outer membrane protein